MLRSRGDELDNMVPKHSREFSDQLCETVWAKSVHRNGFNLNTWASSFWDTKKQIPVCPVFVHRLLPAVTHRGGSVMIWAATSRESFTLMIAMWRCVTAKKSKAFFHRCTLCCRDTLIMLFLLLNVMMPTHARTLLNKFKTDTRTQGRVH